jgi:hypothetical protein
LADSTSTHHLNGHHIQKFHGRRQPRTDHEVIKKGSGELIGCTNAKTPSTPMEGCPKMPAGRQSGGANGSMTGRRMPPESSL